MSGRERAMEMRDLRPGDVVVTHDGRRVAVEAIKPASLFAWGGEPVEAVTITWAQGNVVDYHARKVVRVIEGGAL